MFQRLRQTVSTPRAELNDARSNSATHHTSSNKKSSASTTSKTTRTLGKIHPSNSRRNSGSSTCTESSLKSNSSHSSVPSQVIDVQAFSQKLDCSTKVPASIISYEMVAKVIDSWSSGVKTIPKWECVAGEIFTRRIFEIAPETIPMFGFPETTKYDDPALSRDPTFMAIAIKLIKAIDMAVDFMGPDLAPLEGVLFDLGGRHGSWNARPHHWPVVGEALFYTFEECMKSKFNKKVRECWTIIYNFLGYHMIRGLLHKYPHFAEVETAPAQSVDDHNSKNGKEGASAICSNPEKEPKCVVSTRMMSTEDIQKLSCRTKIPADSITYEMVEHVLSSWRVGILTIPDWEVKTGELFIRYIWKYAPDSRALFGYADNTSYDDPTLSDDKWFVTKGVRLIKAVDMALTFLGPDLAPLEVTLKDLGRRHFHMKVKPEQWPLVGAALFEVFEDCMGKDGSLFTKKVRESWTIMYNFLGYHMIEGLNAEKLRHQETASA